MGRLFYDRDIGCAVADPDAWEQAHRIAPLTRLAPLL